MNIIVSIVLYIVSLFILYIVIETAVRRGINSLIIGQSLEKKSVITGEKTQSFLIMVPLQLIKIWQSLDLNIFMTIFIKYLFISFKKMFLSKMQCL